MVSELFLTTTIGVTIGLLGLSLRYCYKMKCNSTNICCGLIKFDRNVDDEVQLDINNETNSNESKLNTL
jgi:hypothetical protein